MVCFVETKEQLVGIIEERYTESLSAEVIDEIQNYFCDIDVKLILPIHWR